MMPHQKRSEDLWTASLGLRPLEERVRKFKAKVESLPDDRLLWWMQAGLILLGATIGIYAVWWVIAHSVPNLL